MKALAEILDAWFNLTVKMAIAASIGFLLFLPKQLPILSRFIVKKAEINILNTKIEFSDVSAIGPSVKITDDGRLLIAGEDVNDLADRKAQIEQTANNLKSENGGLTTNIKKMEGLLKETQTKLDDANRQLQAAAIRLPEIKPLETSALDSLVKAALADVTNQIDSSAKVAFQADTLLSEKKAAPAVGFGIVFSGDKTPEAAMDEVRKAQKIADGRAIIIYKRQGFWRSVAYYGTRAAADGDIGGFRKLWPDSYTVSIASWCPSPAYVNDATKDMVQEKDCGF